MKVVNRKVSMQNEYPPSRVLIAQSIPQRFTVSPVDTYVDIYTEAERNAIVQKYKTPNLFNGPCVRMDALVDGYCVLSPVMFYDFLCCNIVGFHNKDILAWPKLEEHLRKYGRLDTFEKVLNVKELPNIIGTSTLLHDINNEYLLVERNTSVSVGSGLFACTSSGSMDVDDMSYENPIVGCGLRELKEELNLNCNLAVEGVVMPIQKMQPIVLLTGMVHRPWRELLPTMYNGVDFSKENKRVLIVPKSDLLALISMYKFTDAASFHIFFEAGGNRDSWRKVSGTFVNVNQYYV